MIRLILSLLICLLSTVGYSQETAHTATSQTTEQTPVVRTEAQALDEFETLKSEPDNFLSQLVSMAATIGVLIGLIMIMTWVLKKLLNSRLEQINSKSAIKVLETRNISPKTAIHVVDVYGKNYVVAESVNGVTPLGLIEQLPPKSDFEKIMQNKNPIS